MAIAYAAFERLAENLHRRIGGGKVDRQARSARDALSQNGYSDKPKYRIVILTGTLRRISLNLHHYSFVTF